MAESTSLRPTLVMVYTLCEASNSNQPRAERKVAAQHTGAARRMMAAATMSTKMTMTLACSVHAQSSC